MIRNDRIFEDIRTILLAFFKAQGSPFTDWTIRKDYPEKHYFNKFPKPILWLEPPSPIGMLESQFNYAGQSTVNSILYDNYAYLLETELRLGLWLNNNHGGMEEMNIMRSVIHSLFNNPLPGLPCTTFDVTLGDKTYTDITLYELGFRQITILGDREVAVEDPLEHRREMNIYCQVLAGVSVAI